MSSDRTFPPESMLFAEAVDYCYADSFAIALQRTDVTPAELIAAFFQSTPAWVDWLFRLRNRIVARLGLKTGEGHSRALNPPYRVGDAIGLFRIIGLNDSEVVLGEDDSHLDFRVSLLLIPDEAACRLASSTLVNTRNRLGTAYLFVVKPFHRFIVPIVLKTMARKIDQRLLPPSTWQADARFPDN